MHEQFERALCDYLSVEHICLFNNATTALIVALKALNLTGQVITTPFSFVATTSAILWAGLEPVFVDIDPDTCNLDPQKIEDAITDRTAAILPVHCYGFPCDVERIEAVAQKHGLRVLYDAAHAFGVDCHCGSLLSHGDASVISFHATKVLNTFEGGAIICSSRELKQEIDKYKNFGFVGETAVELIGINGKMNEFSAALGLLQLNYVRDDIEKRKEIDGVYRAAIESIDGLLALPIPSPISHNYSYFPLYVKSGYKLTRDQLYNKLRANGVFARRYFFPLITDFEAYKSHRRSSYPLPQASRVAQEILCLPIYPELDSAEQSLILELLRP